jgi:hypothetical protein
LTGTEELMNLGGVLGKEWSAEKPKQSPRARGVKIGIFMMLLAVLSLPLFGLILRFLIGMPNPWPMGVVFFLLFGGALLRIAYAVMFQEGAGAAAALHPGVNRFRNQREISGATAADTTALPPQSAADYVSPGVGAWRDTNELAEPMSVTDSTTKLLENEK